MLETGMDPEGSFAWSLLKVIQVKIFLFYVLYLSIIKETHVLVPEMNLLYVNDIHALNSCVNGCLDFITNYLSL